MSPSNYHAPDPNHMRWACEHALQHYRRGDRTGSPTTLTVDPVPHFAPGLGASGEWYRVGAISQPALDRHLSVYLDAVTGDILLEQPMQAVESDAQFAAARCAGRMVFIHPESDGDADDRGHANTDRAEPEQDSQSRLVLLRPAHLRIRET